MYQNNHTATVIINRGSYDFDLIFVLYSIGYRATETVQLEKEKHTFFLVIDNKNKVFKSINTSEADHMDVITFTNQLPFTDPDIFAEGDLTTDVEFYKSYIMAYDRLTEHSRDNSKRLVSKSRHAEITKYQNASLIHERSDGSVSQLFHCFLGARIMYASYLYTTLCRVHAGSSDYDRLLRSISFSDSYKDLTNNFENIKSYYVANVFAKKRSTVKTGINHLCYVFNKDSQYHEFSIIVTNDLPLDVTYEMNHESEILIKKIDPFSILKLDLFMSKAKGNARIIDID